MIFVAVALNMAYCIDDGEFQEFASQQASPPVGHKSPGPLPRAAGQSRFFSAVDASASAVSGRAFQLRI